MQYLRMRCNDGGVIYHIAGRASFLYKEKGCLFEMIGYDDILFGGLSWSIYHNTEEGQEDYTKSRNAKESEVQAILQRVPQKDIARLTKYVLVYPYVDYFRNVLNAIIQAKKEAT